MIALTDAQIDDAIPRIEKGLRKYCWIQDNLHHSNLSQDQAFQIRYNDFYKVRRNAGWRARYYALMEQCKAQPAIAFPMVLCALHEQTGQIEASFSSKLIATLDPHKPVIDRFVLTNFGLSLPPAYRKDRISGSILVYERLCQMYQDLLILPIKQNIVRKFNAAFPWANITELKKVDLVLWQTRTGA